VTDDEGTVTAVVTWQLDNEQKQVESFFRLQHSPYYGWDVVQTSLLDDLLAALC
jgi:protein-disulfide isomerase-like protein with CxxC motif